MYWRSVEPPALFIGLRGRRFHTAVQSTKVTEIHLENGKSKNAKNMNHYEIILLEFLGHGHCLFCRQVSSHKMLSYFEHCCRTFLKNHMPWQRMVTSVLCLNTNQLIGCYTPDS